MMARLLDQRGSRLHNHFDHFVAATTRVEAERLVSGDMGQRFCVEVDASGSVVSLEDGSMSAVPAGLTQMLGRLAAAELFDAGFIWAPAGQSGSCQVHVLAANVQSSRSATVLASGEWLDALPLGLTLRELDVLTMLALGLANQVIAERLGLSPRTVTTHVDHILRKTRAESRTAAAVVAVDQALLRLPFPSGVEVDAELLRLGRALRGTSGRQEQGRRLRKKPLLIGAAIPLRGSAVADGIEMARASQLAVEELNARGGVEGREVKLEIVGLDLFDETQVHAAFTQLIDHEADVVTSGYLARQDIAHEIVADAQVPYLHAATLDALTQRVRDDASRYGNIFQVCPGDSTYAPRFVEMMTNLRDRRLWRPVSNRLVVLQRAWEQTDLGIDAASVIADREGWTLDIVRFPMDADFSYGRFAHEEAVPVPAAVMIGNYILEDTVAFLRSFLAQPSDTLLYSLYTPSIPEFRQLLGDGANGLLWATVTGTYSDSPARAFASRFRNRFGVNPGRSHAGIAYDRIGLIAHAWKYSADPRDSRLVSNELRQVIHRGVNGVYYFGDPSQAALTYSGSNGDPSLSQAHLVFQIQGGKQRILDPAPYSDGSFMLPPWFGSSRLS